MTILQIYHNYNSRNSKINFYCFVLRASVNNWCDSTLRIMEFSRWFFSTLALLGLINVVRSMFVMPEIAY